MTMSTTHGRTADGTPITDEMVETFAGEAERGYDVEQIVRGPTRRSAFDGLGGIISRIGTP
jgi:hypothetical protein